MRRGFTLVELTLTVLIIAIVMALFYGVVASTVQAAHRVEEIMQGSEVGPAILSQIREDLEGAFVTDPKVTQFVGFDRQGSSGGRDRLDFLTTTMAFDRERDDADPRFLGVNEVGYQIQDNKKDPTLGVLFRRMDPFVDAEPVRGGKLIELYDRVKIFEVQYIEEPGKLPLMSWDSKEKGGKLPRAIRIELLISVAMKGGEEFQDRRYVMTVTRPE